MLRYNVLIRLWRLAAWLEGWSWDKASKAWYAMPKSQQAADDSSGGSNVD